LLLSRWLIQQRTVQRHTSSGTSALAGASSGTSQSTSLALLLVSALLFAHLILSVNNALACSVSFHLLAANSCVAALAVAALLLQDVTMPSIGYTTYLALVVALAACHSVHVHALGGAGQSTASDDNTPLLPPPVTASDARRAAASDDNTTTCPSGLEPGNYEFAAGKGKNGQGVSYGIPMMQADKLAAVADKGNVLFCLALMGYDERNKDLPKGTTIAIAIPVGLRDCFSSRMMHGEPAAFAASWCCNMHIV
jgi:hypothetical protein